MSYLANGHTNTLEIPGGGATVTFRGGAIFDDELELVRRTQHLQALTDEQERAYAFRAERALLMVESWTLKDASGEPLPLEAHVLRRALSRPVAVWIDEEATRRYNGRTQEEEGPFDSRSPQPSEART